MAWHRAVPIPLFIAEAAAGPAAERADAGYETQVAARAGYSAANESSSPPTATFQR